MPQFGLYLEFRLVAPWASRLVLVPLMLFGDIPGQEIEYPMAVVILGGLITSTLLNLFVVPSLYLRFGKGKNLGKARIEELAALDAAPLGI